MKRKYYDATAAAEYLGISKQDFYALVRNKELELAPYLSSTGDKRMYKREGLNLLLNIKTDEQ